MIILILISLNPFSSSPSSALGATVRSLPLGRETFHAPLTKEVSALGDVEFVAFNDVQADGATILLIKGQVEQLVVVRQFVYDVRRHLTDSRLGWDWSIW